MDTQPSLHDVKAENETLKQKYELLKKKNRNLENRIRSFRKTIKKYSGGKVPDTWKRRIVKERLNSKLSEGTLEMLLSKKPRRHTKKWTQADYARTLQLRLIGGKSSVNYVRKNVIPMPSEITVQQKMS